MAMPVMRDVPSYIASLPPMARAVARRLRAAVRTAAPQAQESMSYGIPFYSLRGRLVYWGVFREHYSLFGLSASVRKAFAVRLEGFAQSKGTIKFPLSKPVPVRLVGALVRAQARENERGRKPV